MYERIVKSARMIFEWIANPARMVFEWNVKPARIGKGATLTVTGTARAEGPRLLVSFAVATAIEGMVWLLIQFAWHRVDAGEGAFTCRCRGLY